MLRLGLVLVVVLGACGTGDSGDGTRRDLAKLKVKQLAAEAYPQWSMRAPGASECPTLAELAAFTASKDLRDPWGAELVVRCSDLPPGAHGIAVSSNGPDGKPGTADDVRSWE